MVAQCQMRFKLKNKCESKRDVTIAYNSNYEDFNIAHHIIKPLLKYKKEACWNLSLVTWASLSKQSLKVDLKSIDTFLNQAIEPYSTYMFHGLIEYLQLFLDGAQPARKRTLAIFTTEYLRQNVVDVLYKLQTESNVAVILVYLNHYIHDEYFFNLNKFPRHLKFGGAFWAYDDQRIKAKQVVDVIKNPDFNIFKFNKNLPTHNNT